MPPLDRLQEPALRTRQRRARFRISQAELLYLARIGKATVANSPRGQTHLKIAIS